MQNVTKYLTIPVFYFIIAAVLFTTVTGCNNKETLIPRPGAVPTADKNEIIQISADGKFKIMSFNIRYGSADDGPNAWPKRNYLVFDVFKKNQPDIVGVQEALRYQLDEIREKLPQYSEIGVARDDGKQAGEYTAILYRTSMFTLIESGTFWFSDTPQIPGSKSWGNHIPRTCTWAILQTKDAAQQTQQIYVYNVHLDHQSQTSREKSTQLLAQKISEIEKENPIIIVTGDFNAAESNPAITSFITDTKLKDSYRILNPNAENAGTFNSFRGDADGPKIDYIFISEPNNKLEILEAKILHDNKNNKYPSDHFPVTTRIILKPL